MCRNTYINDFTAYSCSVAVESKTQAADHTLFDVLKRKLKLEKIDVRRDIVIRRDLYSDHMIRTRRGLVRRATYRLQLPCTQWLRKWISKPSLKRNYYWPCKSYAPLCPKVLYLNTSISCGLLMIFVSRSCVERIRFERRCAGSVRPIRDENHGRVEYHIQIDDASKRVRKRQTKESKVSPVRHFNAAAAKGLYCRAKSDGWIVCQISTTGL